MPTETSQDDSQRSGANACSDASPSVIHIPSEDMTHADAEQWTELMSNRNGRTKLKNWLMMNDPLVVGAYAMAEAACVDEDDIDRAVVLILVKTFRGHV